MFSHPGGLWAYSGNLNFVPQEKSCSASEVSNKREYDWQIYRGDQVVVGHFGSAKQALQAGTYTIKPQNYPVFNPFEVQISDGRKTIVP
jgi:hypothetical protein